MSSRAGGWLGDAAYGLGWALTRWMPEPVAQAAFAQVADQVWRRRGRGVRRLQANLRRACPDGSAADIERLSRAAMRSYLRYWCEAFRLPVWSREQVFERVVVHDEHVLRDAYARGRGVVAPLPHLANWDLAGAWACLSGTPLTTVAERLEPERLFRRFVAYREGLGMEVLPLTGGDAPLRTLFDRARAGRLICLVADRDLSANGVEVDLLGHPARLPAGPAMVARTTGATLMPVTLAYDGPRLHITMHPPVEPVAGRDGVRIMTQGVADAFTAGIRAHPQDWHMLQRVFVEDLDTP
jgi:phosphatidylinositol dimannoside acyltransferase